MLARIFALLPLVAFVVADQCNTGPNLCCDTVGPLGEVSQEVDSLGLGGLIGGLDIPVAAIVGLSCTSIVGANECEQQPVCCEDNYYNGLVNVGCSPIDLDA